MKAKNLLILCIVAAALIGLARWSSSRKQASTGPTPGLGKPLLPALQEGNALGQIERLVFESATSTITVEQQDGAWVATSKYNYPVDFNRLRAFVDKVAAVKIGHAIPQDDAQLKELQLLAPVSGETHDHFGVVVRLQNKAGKDIASLIVGKERKKAPAAGMAMPGFGGYTDGRFVVVDGKAYLVAEEFYDLPTEDASWFNTELANVSGADIADITTRNADGKTLTLKRPEKGGDLTVLNLKADEEMDSSGVSGLANTLGYLSFSDVADPSLADKDLGLDKPIVCTVRTQKHRTFMLRVGGTSEDKKSKYIRINAAYDAPKPKDATGEDQKPDEDAVKLAEETRELNDRISKWVYIVEAYKVDSITIDREKFVKKKEKEEAKDGEKKDPHAGHGH